MSVGAADAWPNCTFKCTAGDVSLVSIYVVLPGGACEPGGASMAQVYGRFTASAKRYAVILMGDLHVEGGSTTRLTTCAGDLPAGTTDVLLTTVSWPCGNAITLGNIVVSWSTNSETCGDATCASRAAQCAKGEDVAVTTPLVVDFSSNAPQCVGTPMAFTNTSTGGTAPYTYSWDFGDGGTSTQA
ncbi:MAG: PKD domain-containing protein, partial [Methanothrix sp.]|nr:PKD domain-containing protein [Methanothrix sp.]